MGVALPYKDWNTDKDPGQLPAWLLPVGVFTITSSNQGGMPGGHPTWEGANKTKT